jgi:TonB family protein
MNIFAKHARNAIIPVVLALSFNSLQSASMAAHVAPPPVESTALTLDHLKNASYQIPDLCCGYKNIKLKNGTGTKDGVTVVFGRAVFGKLGSIKGTSAVVHVAYHDESLGWLQQLIFIEAKNNKLLQIAEYGLDEGEDIKSMKITQGETVIESQLPIPASAGKTSQLQKITRIRVDQSRNGCVLKASEWQRDITTAQLKPFQDIRPYLYTVEDRIGKNWSPTQKDRGEHVVVSFKIKPSGALDDLHVANSSDVATADKAALEAVANAAPFPPVPSSAGDALEVCFEFQAGVNLQPSQHHRD